MELKDFSQNNEQDLTNRQFDEILLKMINENDPRQQGIALQRLKNIGKLFVDMNITIERPEIVKQQVDKEFKQKELELLAIENDSNTLRLIQIDHAGLEVELNLDRLLDSLRAKDILWEHDQIQGTHFKPLKINKSSEVTQPIYIPNIQYIPEEHKLNGVQSLGNCQEQQRTKAYILKALIHQITGERFYQVYTEKPNEPTQGCNIIISGETLQDWDRLRLIDIVYPTNIIDTDNTIIGDIQCVNNLSIEQQEDTQNVTNSEEYTSYKDGKKQLLELLGYNDETQMLKALADADKTEQLVLINNTTSYNKETQEQYNEDTYTEQLQKLYNFRVDTRQPIEEYIYSNIHHIGQLSHKGTIGRSQLNNPINLRIVETNANKVQNQIIDSGLLEVCDITKGKKLNYIKLIKSKAIQNCQSLYPSQIELSIVDMLQIFRQILPTILQESSNYKQYIRSCYDDHRTKCNFKKRDRYIQLAKINPYIQLDLAQKKQPKDFINHNKKFQYNGKNVQLIALKILNGLDACESSIRLGNIYQEEKEFRKMKVVK